MQTVETLNEGLKRGYRLTIPAAEIDSRVDAQVGKVAPQIRMPGFRPGKVPANLVRKMHGPQLRQEALNAAVQEGVQALIADKGFRPAMAPSVDLDAGYEDGGDAEVMVGLEVLPDVPKPQIEGLTLERLTVAPDEAKVDDQIAQIASSQKRHDASPEGHAAGEGDLVVMDYRGTVDGVAFEGGTGEGMSVELGSGRLIPGFEEQLAGVKAGDSRTLELTFPKDYPAKELAGKDAVFEVTVTEVKVPGEMTIDDAFAKAMGLDDLDTLKTLIRGQQEQELNGLTRTHMKRKLLDQLAAGHDFPVPPSMVDAEFEQIWQQLEHEAEHEEDVDAAKAELESERGDYRAIAERRVRLGLLLSEIGQANGIEVTAQEMQRLVAQAAQQYRPQDRERFAQYIQQEPMAAAQLRAPLYEDKVVDFLFDKAEISDRTATREELEAAIEADEGFSSGTHHHDQDHDHKPKAKKAAKKAVTEAADETAEAKAPAKKAAARKTADEAKAVEPDEQPKKAPAKKAASVAADAETPAKPRKSAPKPAADVPEAADKPKKAQPKKAAAKG